ncbi:MAG: response regulator [Spirochaetota bacterium]
MKKIMIVEDEIILTMAIKRSLDDEGFFVLPPVLSGEDAVKRAVTDSPDLVIMDVTLQGEMDGIEATMLIKKELNIPVIITTAHSDAVMIERIESSGCDDYLFKPVNFAEMVEHVTKLLV